MTTAATTTALDGDDDDDHDDVPVRFNPPQSWTRSGTRAARRFAKAAGLMGSESSVPNLFGGQAGSETAVGQILGNNLGRFGSGFDEPAASNNSLAYGDLFPISEPDRLWFWASRRRKYGNSTWFWLFLGVF
jgi:hypothetical protein